MTGVFEKDAYLFWCEYQRCEKHRSKVSTLGFYGEYLESCGRRLQCEDSRGHQRRDYTGDKFGSKWTDSWIHQNGRWEIINLDLNKWENQIYVTF